MYACIFTWIIQITKLSRKFYANFQKQKKIYLPDINVSLFDWIFDVDSYPFIKVHQLKYMCLKLRTAAKAAHVKFSKAHIQSMDCKPNGMGE